MKAIEFQFPQVIVSIEVTSLEDAYLRIVDEESLQENLAGDFNS